jgi:hypothetical protein
MKMKKIIVALLVVALCMVAPAVAVEWTDLPTDMMVLIEYPYPPGDACGTYFDMYLDDDWDQMPETVYPGWCVQTGVPSIKNTPYCAHLSSTLGVSGELNMVNWILNNKGCATYGEIQAAIWMVMGQTIPAQYAAWDNAISQELVALADDTYVPGPSDIGAVLVEPRDRNGQKAVIEVPIKPCPPPVPEFPTMMIPVFLVGSVLVAASVLKKE